MSGVVQKFFLTSMIMWMAPLVILYGFNYQIFPGSSQLSSSSQTLLSGFLAVISVNVVIVYYILMAMKERTNHDAQPDPTFLAAARASITQPLSTRTNDDDDANTREKVEYFSQTASWLLGFMIVLSLPSIFLQRFWLKSRFMNASNTEIPHFGGNIHSLKPFSLSCDDNILHSKLHSLINTEFILNYPCPHNEAKNFAPYAFL